MSSENTPEPSRWKLLYDSRAAELTKLRDDFESKSAELVQLKRRQTLLEEELSNIKHTLTFTPPMVSDRTIQIRWGDFVELVSMDRDLWTYDGECRTMDWWCKSPGCSESNQRHADSWETTYKYSLKTWNHRWLICGNCRGSEYDRRAVLTRPVAVNSTRPTFQADDMIRLDPFIHNNPATIKKLLELGGVLNSDITSYIRI
jgi:hypothetical protein